MLKKFKGWLDRREENKNLRQQVRVLTLCVERARERLDCFSDPRNWNETFPFDEDRITRWTGSPLPWLYAEEIVLHNDDDLGVPTYGGLEKVREELAVWRA